MIPRLFSLISLEVALCLLLSLSPAPAADDVVHVTYWEKWTDIEGSAMQRVVDQFNHSQKKIHVDFLSISDIERKTILATAGGDPPDVAGLFSQDMYTFSDFGALTPLDEFMKQDGQTQDEWLSRYYPVFADICTYHDHVYGVISTPAVSGLYYNKTLFREAGLDPNHPPQTLAELDAFSDKMTKKDPVTHKLLQVGFLPEQPGWPQWGYSLWMGGSLWDGHQITIGKDPLNLVAYQWVKGYSDRYGVAAINSFSGGVGNLTTPQYGFFSGKIAMLLQGVWLDHYIRLYSPHMDYGLAPWPVCPQGAKDFTLTIADVLTIPRGAKHPHEAWEFIKFVNSINPEAKTRDELQGEELLCFLQEKSSAFQVWSPYFTNNHPNPNIKFYRQFSSSPHAVHCPKIGIWQEYSRELNVLFDRVRLLTNSPAEALSLCQDRVQKSFTWYQDSLDRRNKQDKKNP